MLTQIFTNGFIKFMEDKMKSSKTSKQISVRLPAQDFERLALEAENQGATIAEIARQRIQLAEKQVELRDLINNLRAEITQNTFVITSVVAGLDPDEAHAAKVSIRNKLARKVR